MTVDGKVLQSEPHFEFAWGEHLSAQEPSSAERLATCLIADSLGDEKAHLLSSSGRSRDFAHHIVANLEEEWEITSTDIEEWQAYACGTGNSVESRPRIVANPNYRLQSA